jgi:hypothetical protein
VGRGASHDAPFFHYYLGFSSFFSTCSQTPERVRKRFFFFFYRFHLPIYSFILIYLLGDAGESENARVYDPSHESLKRSLKEILESQCPVIFTVQEVTVKGTFQNLCLGAAGS